jgi:hypothetical protein
MFMGVVCACRRKAKVDKLAAEKKESEERQLLIKELRSESAKLSSFIASKHQQQPQQQQPTQKISAAFSSLESFLKSKEVDAASALSKLKEQDVRLWQLPKISADRLQTIGVKAGPAERIVTAAQKYLAE